MPQVNVPTARRAISEICSRFTLRGIISVILWAILFLSVFVGLATSNVSVLEGFVAGVLWIALVILESVYEWRILFIYDWLCHGVDYHTARQNRKRGHASAPVTSPIPLWEILLLFGIPVLVTLASTCLFQPDARSVWVVDGTRTSGTGGHVFAIPFANAIRSVSVNQDVRFFAVATTADGHKVRGIIDAELRLSPEVDQVLLAGRQKDPDAAIQSRMKQAFESQFRQEVARQQLADLKSTLVLEYNTSTAANRNLLRAVGVVWNGTISVTDIHPYLTE